MKRGFIFFVPIMLFLLVIQGESQNQNQSIGKEIDFPEVPRVSAYEAYIKYKSGKAIIIHAGGEVFESRHILGAFNVHGEAVSRGEIELPNFPMTGIEIFTYCY